MIAHIVAHSLGDARPLGTIDACWLLWRALRRTFDRVLAASLMPNHLHLVLVTTSADQLRRELARVLAGFARTLGSGPLWQRVPPPVLIGDPGKLARQIRYVLLNAMRAGYFADPACHVWSTYRDVIGATVDPWVDIVDLAAQLGRGIDGFVEWFHGYVSGDPSVQVGGTPMPVPAPPRLDASTPLDLVRAAACAVAATAPYSDRRRALAERHAYVLGARHQGWRDAATIATHGNMSVETARRLARRQDDSLLRATTLYIGDDRLLVSPRFRRAA